MGFFSSIGDAIGGIVGGAANVVGGILGNNSQSFANSANLDFARQQFEYQKELHKNQLQWRVEDAKKAGLHPMAALGLQSSSFSPVSSNVQANDYSWIGDLGQSAGYAAMKGKDKEQQREALDLASRQATLGLRNMELENEGIELENEYRRFQLQQAIAGGTSQALGSSGSASTRGLGRRYAIDGQADSRLPIKDGAVPAGEPRFQFMETERPGVFSFEPGNDWSQIYEDKSLLGIPLDIVPLAKAYGKDLYGRATGAEINGMVYSDSHGGWVKAGGPLDDTKTSKRSARYWRDRFAGSSEYLYGTVRKFDQFLKNLNSLKYYPFRRTK